MSEVKKIDFSKYRTPELAEQVSAILNPVVYLWLAIKWMAIWLVLFCLMSAMVFWSDEHLSVFLTAFIIAGIAGMVTGLFFGVARAVTSGVERITRMITLILDVVQHITNDCWGLSTGKQELPERKELIRAVYLQVLMPTIEQVVADRFWILSKPLLWGYRISLGRLVNGYIEERADETSEATLEKVDQASGLGSTVVKTGCAIPLYALFLISLCIGIGCLWMVHLGELAVFSSGENPPGEVIPAEETPASRNQSGKTGR